ncbi:hypothetical protein ECE41_13995 [Acinetobacter baumannii]|nr:hypothetical protein [Acinetobacter baumannii]
MTQRLELHQVEQLTACKISLLLGLNAEQNYIEQFFRFSLRLLKCQKALLTFNQEPSVHDKFHRTLILSGFCLLKIAKISLNSSFFPKPIKR